MTETLAVSIPKDLIIQIDSIAQDWRRSREFVVEYLIGKAISKRLYPQRGDRNAK